MLKLPNLENIHLTPNIMVMNICLNTYGMVDTYRKLFVKKYIRIYRVLVISRGAL